MTHVHSWSVGAGGDATIKTKEAADGRWHFIITDGSGTVIGRGPADGFPTDQTAHDHGLRLLGGYWRANPAAQHADATHRPTANDPH